MSRSYPILTTVARLAGVVGVLVGSFWLTNHFVRSARETWRGLLPDPDFLLGGGIALAVVGLLMLAFGEVIGVLFAIEANTRRAVDSKGLGAQ